MKGSDFWKAFSVPLGLLILFVLAFWGVFGLSKNLTKTPTIEVISGNEIVTDQAEVPITGVVHDTSKLVVDGREVPVSTEGGFSAVVPVDLGENSIELVAGNKTQTKTTVKITREEVQKAIIATSTSSDNLANSGPLEAISGSFGLAAILLSLVVYRRSMRGNALQKA